MAVYLLRRIGETAITLLLVTLLVFCLTRLTGDPTTLLLPPEATEEMREYFRQHHGLDRSLPIQYITYLRNIAAGDFGQSFRLGEPAIVIVWQALGPTLKLAGWGMLLSILIGMPLGIWAAASRRPSIKRLVSWYASLGQALPPFWTGLTLVMVFALWIPLLPTSGYGKPSNYILPALTLAISTSSAIAGLTAANMTEALKSDFIQLERVLGLSEMRILLKHALRNASLPIVTYLGLQFGLILGGAIVTERVFAWPGIGQRIVEAILGRDYPVVQAVVLVTALMFMLINLLVDILYMILDPEAALMSTVLDAPPEAKVSLFSRLRGFRSSGETKFPVVTVLCCSLLVFAALFGHWVAPYAKDAVDLASSLVPPFWQPGGTTAHLLGTDQLGRDIFSRLIAGARVSLATAAAATMISGVFGVIFGLIAGYVGGFVEAVAMRIVDAFLSLPFILLALALVATLGSGFGNIIMVMVIANWARYARLVRSEVISIKGRDYVTLARIAGVRPLTIMWRHVLPNALNSVVVLAILDVGRAIILESSLSFLGVGIQPPDVSWGLMLADGRTFLGFAWWLTTLPGLTIVFAVLSFNSLGRWLRIKFDPRGQL